jgi:hypothetical protein
MNTPLDPGNDWNPNETFERLARERRRSPEELRARLTQLADDRAPDGGHLSFELLKEIDSPSEDGMVSEEDRRHLEGCAFCSDLLASLKPPQERIEEFAQAAVAGFSRPARGAASAANGDAASVRSRRPARWLAAAASLVGVFVAGGIAWQAAPLAAGNWLARVSPALAVKFANDPKWLSIEESCGQQSGAQSACTYLATAALYRLDGRTHAARTLIVSGLEQAGATTPVAMRVGDALQTPTSSVPRERQEAAQLANVLVHNTEVPTRWIEAARLQQKAGEHVEALYAIDRYLEAVNAKPAATEAFRAGYARTVATLGGERNPTLVTTPSSDPAVEKAATGAAAVTAADHH